MILDKKGVLRLCGHGLGKEKRAVIQEFLDTQPDVRKEWNEWTRAFTDYMKGRTDMAKHPHKLILQQKKTWRCTLQGCAFFVHRGLEHILIGKNSICWGCGDEFLFDEGALRHEMPKCGECRTMEVAQPVVESSIPETVEMTPEKRKLYKELGLIK